LSNPAVRRLLCQQRWGALATLDEAGHPSASNTALAPDPGRGRLLVHVSRLAAHTRHMLERPRVALVIGDQDRGDQPQGDQDRDLADPQELPRLGIQGEALPIHPQDSAFPAARGHYLARLPRAEARFGFSDFVLFGIRPITARFVGGFAQARSLEGGELEALIRSLDARPPQAPNP